MKRIYIAEDDPALANLMKTVLDLQGSYDVALFSDGLKLYQTILKDSPDLVILDIIIPSLSGLAISRLIKHHHDYRQIPTVIVSSIIDREIRARALQAGADAFLSKPFDPDELLQLVNKLVITENGRS